ncbi:hypothetical protein KRZ98_18390 [Sphingobium sp. AS12]|uniref:hypothetical protein n=1 Tax=Sphingobium sp. AS12 TaxID=2849495 RepID=UPI001C31E2F5|nr:hypothetical protein [Sphingobium sp. AS12]MBV2150208.1 hypothetical protein [Sphingobium sp. AS12]
MTTKKSEQAASTPKLPLNLESLTAAIKSDALKGLSSEGFVQFFKAVSNASEAVMAITDKASEHQKRAADNIGAAISGDSETLRTIAEKLETDEARLEFARIYIEREKEKTRQADSAEKVNRSNNNFYLQALATVGTIVLGAIGVVAKIRR